MYDLRAVCVRFVKSVRCWSETSFHAVLGDAELTLGHEKERRSRVSKKHAHAWVYEKGFDDLRMTLHHNLVGVIGALLVVVLFGGYQLWLLWV